MVIQIRQIGLISLIGIIVFALSGPCFADTVYLSSGDAVKGVVVEEHHDRIMLSTYKGEIEIFKVSIDQIFFDDEEKNYLYLADRALADGDFTSASGLYQKAGQINPDYERVKESLLRLNDVMDREKLSITAENSADKINEQLGIEIASRKNMIEVKSALDGSAADETGVSEGDLIISVWGESVKFMDIKQAANIIAGAPNTAVKLTIQKNIFLETMPLPWFKKILSFLMFNDFGFKLSLRPSGLEVSYINPSGAAYKNGLRYMDEVVCVNGEPIRYMPLSMVRRKIFQSSLKEVVLTVKRNLIVMRR